MYLVRAAVAVGVILAFCPIALVWAVPQQRTALLLEKSGALLPDLKAYSEIKSGTVVELGDGGRIKFLHYPTCTTVVVSKGSVRFGDKEYEVIGAKPDSEKTGACPRRVALKNVGEAGAGNLRSMDDMGLTPLTFTPKPEFVLVGERAEDYAMLRIAAGGQSVLEAPLSGPKFEWPKNAPPLKKGISSYELTLVPKALGVEKVKKRFKVQASHTDDGATSAIMLIDLD